MSIDVTPSEMTLSLQVAEEIRAWMGRRRLSQAELARRLSVSKMWISYRLSGVQPIDLNDLQRIANTLGIAVVDLLPADIRDKKSSAIAPYVEMADRRSSSVRRPPDNRPPARSSAATAPRLHRTSVIPRSTGKKAA